jgi:hypothetical protein
MGDMISPIKPFLYPFSRNDHKPARPCGNPEIHSIMEYDGI